ncbi:MAG: hypothetical protein GX279_13505 [Clostridiaceae bacterium]|jgi:hypothetical protein|nr:hypothetical protein [Clostridiaceae bacterium]
MDKFTIVDIGGNARDIPYLIRELRQNNLIAATEKDAGYDTIYLTNNLVAVKRIASEYDGLMLDVLKK